MRLLGGVIIRGLRVCHSLLACQSAELSKNHWKDEEIKKHAGAPNDNDHGQAPEKSARVVREDAFKCLQDEDT